MSEEADKTAAMLAAQAPALWNGALEEARSLIGVNLRRTGQWWNTEASPDAVRASAKGRLKYDARQTHRYSQEELESIANAIETEELRDAQPRFREDVEVGTSAPPMRKGPLNITDMICWYAGGGHSYQAHRRATMHRKPHPADAYVDPKSGAQENPRAAMRSRRWRAMSGCRVATPSARSGSHGSGS